VTIVDIAVDLARKQCGVVSAAQVAYLENKREDAYYRASYVESVLVESGKFRRTVNRGAIGKRITLLKLKESRK
jgi:hypothetical protein